MSKITDRIFAAFDSLEFIFIAICATALFGAIVYGVWSGIKESGNTLAFVGFSLLVIGCIVGILRDIHRKKFSGISISISIFWVLCVLYVVFKLYFA